MAGGFKDLELWQPRAKKLLHGLRILNVKLLRVCDICHDDGFVRFVIKKLRMHTADWIFRPREPEGVRDSRTSNFSPQFRAIYAGLLLLGKLVFLWSQGWRKLNFI